MSPIEALLGLVAQLLGLDSWAGGVQGTGTKVVPDWVAELDPWHRGRLLEAILAVARCDGRLDAQELRLVQRSFPAMTPTADTLRTALVAVQQIRTPEEALAHVRACAPDLSGPARRFALDAAVAVLSLGEGAHRRLAPSLAAALGLSAADAERALADNVVFLRQDPRGRTPYR